MYNKILVPLDGSKMAECVLNHVAEIASNCRVPEVILLTAIESVSSPYFLPGDRTEFPEVMAENERKKNRIWQKASEYLGRTSQELSLKGLAVKTEIIEEKEDRKVADIILDYAQKNRIDLIIMSTHGRTGISRWTLGSIADKIVRHAVMPVLTVAPVGCQVQ
jgi:nucleotide-binding universal stress UspA family protein